MEELLSSYQGVLLVVSHDRRFMQSLTDRLFVLEGDSYVRMYDGLYYDVRPPSHPFPALFPSPRTLMTNRTRILASGEVPKYP